ncbi:hypothetical protein [Clostridium sp. OS1-26]|uniref:hypothetical protein n=1 Tax=Clostridium sp. OS1-26 TaxID=3070681 RepID=UPI0027E1C070|nr:hypothetical protein [Clostridium sp. OS1-26]WML33179.1 hypothetical protein RCG18_17720 [Clostridium sp. OS1-26]
MSCNHNPAVTLGAQCIVQIGTRFFLLVELETPIERVIVIEITAAQFAALRAAGVPVCPILNAVPTAVAGTTVELQCTFIVDDEAFIVFEIENARERLVLVRSPLCTVI